METDIPIKNDHIPFSTNDIGSPIGNSTTKFDIEDEDKSWISFDDNSPMKRAKYDALKTTTNIVDPFDYEPLIDAGTLSGRDPFDSKRDIYRDNSFDIINAQIDEEDELRISDDEPIVSSFIGDTPIFENNQPTDRNSSSLVTLDNSHLVSTTDDVEADKSNIIVGNNSYLERIVESKECSEEEEDDDDVHTSVQPKLPIDADVIVKQVSFIIFKYQFDCLFLATEK